jgi:uncharacterized protein YlxP (DUF503 family)
VTGYSKGDGTAVPRGCATFAGAIMAAVVGVLQFTLLIRGSFSLKDKRRVLRGIKDRMSHHYNISIAEVDSQDIRNQAVMAIAMVGSDHKYVETALNKIVDQLRIHREAELTDHYLEML